MNDELHIYQMHFHWNSNKNDLLQSVAFDVGASIATCCDISVKPANESVFNVNVFKWKNGGDNVGIIKFWKF